MGSRGGKRGKLGREGEKRMGRLRKLREAGRRFEDRGLSEEEFRKVRELREAIGKAREAGEVVEGDVELEKWKRRRRLWENGRKREGGLRVGVSRGRP